jgi:hypothetical protein
VLLGVAEMIIAIAFCVGTFFGFWAGFLVHALAVVAKRSEISEPLNSEESLPTDFRNRAQTQ